MGKISALLISIVLFSGIVVGISGIYGDFDNSYDYGTNPEMEDIEFLSKTEDIAENLADMESSLEESRITGIPQVDLPLTMISGVWNSLLLLLDVPTIFTAILSGLGGLIGVPAWFTGAISIIVGLLIVFALWEAVTKVRV